MILFLTMVFIGCVYLSFRVGKKTQYENDKELFNTTKNDEQLLDVVYNHFGLEVKKELTDQEIMAEVYKDRYDPDIVDCEDRIYLSEGMYLCKNGDIIED